MRKGCEKENNIEHFLFTLLKSEERKLMFGLLYGREENWVVYQKDESGAGKTAAR